MNEVAGAADEIVGDGTETKQLSRLVAAVVVPCP